MIDKIVEKYGKKLVFVLLSIGIIVFFNLYNIREMYGPVVFPDEVGYWSIGAYANGYDWSGVMSKASYYGWGYGSIVLAPLFLFAKSPIVLYRAAILVNTGILCCNFLVLRKVAETLQIASNQSICTLSALVVTLYSSYVFFSKMTYAESLLVLLFDILVLLLLNYENLPGHMGVMLLALNSAWMFAIHQRSLGVIGVLCIFFCWRRVTKRVDGKVCIAFLICLIVTICLCVCIKNNVVSKIWINPDNASGNDFTGQMGKIEYMFSMEGIIAFLFNVLGRIVYLGNATFFLFYFGMEKMIQELYFLWKERNRYPSNKQKRQEDFNFFLCMSSFAAIVVSALFMIYPTRFEHIIYGRYSEYVIAPLLLYAILSLDFTVVCKRLKYMIPLHIIISVAVYLYSSRLEFKITGDFSTTGIRWLKGLEGMQDSVKYLIWAMLVISFIASVLYLVGKKSKVLFMVLLGYIWLYASDQVCCNVIYENQEINREFYAFSKKAEQFMEDESIYYLLEEEERSTSVYWSMFRLQFFLYDKDLKAISYDDMKRQKEGYIVIYKNSKNAEKNFGGNTLLLLKNDRFRLEKINGKMSGAE